MSEIVHVMRESTTRPRSFRLICGANPRQSDAWVLDEGDDDGDNGAVNCEKCIAILDRERAAREALA